MTMKPMTELKLPKCQFTWSFLDISCFTDFLTLYAKFNCEVSRCISLSNYWNCVQKLKSKYKTPALT